QRMVPTQQLDSAQRFGPTVSNSADDVRTAPYQGTAEPVTPPSGVPLPSRAEGRSVATRLQELSDLRRRGLVSDDEYDYKRRQLLDQL
ncbi:MAG TPA: SHOCT domain-containing protein, partial [Acidimicrobiales bacterium]|nr:SHOCT domain-containing protein [Acidimicrobiales bacterium]